VTIETELLDLERRFWTEGPDFYRRHVDESCLVALPEQTGVVGPDALAASVGEGPRWRDVHFDVQGVSEPCAEIALVTYRAHATRSDGERYASLVSSAYVRRDGEWKLAFHQQTPLGLEPRPSSDVEVAGREPTGVGTHLGIDTP